MSVRIVILGGGESGTGSAILAQKMGFKVFLSDMSMISEKYKQELDKYGIEWEEGKHTEEKIVLADEVIKSPGIPDTAYIIKVLLKKNIPLISEIEFAGRYNNAKTICITGSNGKTTTTMLIYHLLKKAGMNVGLAGNVGFSFARQVANESFDYYVIELSSFQLDGMFEFKADIGVLLNITPDHLDRYDYKMENYVQSKFRIAQNMGTEESLIYCFDDPETINEFNKRSFDCKVFPFSITQNMLQGARLVDQEIRINVNKEPFTMSITELALQGKHNMYNSMAAGIVGKILELRNDVIRESLCDFKNVEHRLEHVAKIQGVEFINDSKATNINSVWYALESMTTPVVLILGGVDKGNDYQMLLPMVKQKVKAIVCMGKDNSRIHEAFEDSVEIIVNTFSAADAVNMAYHLAKKGDTVLLSPACASFDLFKNYEDRGNQFKSAVREL